MAATAKKLNLTTRGATYGSAAYDLSYLGNAAAEERIPGRVREPLVRPRPRTRAKTRTRTGLQVREQQKISLFAIAGFLAVAAFAMVLLLSYMQLTKASDEVVKLKKDLSKLQTQEAILMAQYESTFDMTTIEEQYAAKGAMTKPQSDQVYYIDMSGPDDAVVSPKGTQEKGLSGTMDSIHQFFAMAVEYFK